MSSNLHVSYDLYEPSKNYEAVIAKIKTLGSWAKIHKSFWYVKSTMSASDAAAAVWGVMDKNDTIYVVDATTNNAAWYGLSQEASNYIKDQWYK